MAKFRDFHRDAQSCAELHVEVGILRKLTAPPPSDDLQLESAIRLRASQRACNDFAWKHAQSSRIGRDFVLASNETLAVAMPFGIQIGGICFWLGGSSCGSKHRQQLQLRCRGALRSSSQSRPAGILICMPSEVATPAGSASVQERHRLQHQASRCRLHLPEQLSEHVRGLTSPFC